MKSLTKAIVTCMALILFASSCEENSSSVIPVDVLSNSQIDLTFTENGEAVMGTEIRINIDNYFENGNLFEGTTDENGLIEVGPLNLGVYYFQLNPQSNGFLTGSLQVTSSDTSYFYELRDYQSSVSYTTNSPGFYTTQMFLIPDQIVSSELSNSDKISASISGSLIDSQLTFENVLIGNYTLGVFDEFNGVYPLHGSKVTRDYDIQGSFNLDAYSLLNGTSWSTTSTTLLEDGSNVPDLITSISFSIETITLNFADGTLHSQPYIAGLDNEASIDVFLYPDSEEIKLPELDAFLFIAIDGDGLMGIEYFDEAGIVYQSFLNINDGD